MGIVGFGRIGQALAKLAVGAGMNVIFSDIHDKDMNIELSLFDGQKVKFTCENVGFNKVLKQSDFISVHVPGGDLIGSDEIAKMKDGVFLLNAARGGVINEQALLDALESNKVAGAALDVFTKEPTPAIKLLMNGKISFIFHIGAATLEAQDRIGTELAAHIDALA